MDRNLRAFLAVARAGNLTAAADQIGLTQPALTKTIRRVEREFGTRLFERTSRGMTLTDAGRLLQDRCEKIELHYRQGKEEIGLLKAGVLNEFRIAAGVAYHVSIAPDLVRLLSLDFPKTRFVLHFQVAGQAIPRLMAGEIEMLLGALDSLPAEGIETVPLLHVDMVVYACKNSELGRMKQVKPTDLAGKKWVVYQRDPVMFSRLNSYAAENMLPEPEICMEIDSLMASFRVVRGTEYVTAATSVVRQSAEEEGLRHVKLDRGIWYFESGATYRSSLRNFPIMKRAIELLKQLTAAYSADHSSEPSPEEPSGPAPRAKSQPVSDHSAKL
ncbi:LysR family transcriptional regulator [Rhizobium sp. SSA_523]|uniref:LysR family transcriptional regulator n=1 Tax=Rhizobium sp. SSA_523 TaxID=2952477 RepID=UPI002090C141|nr:LysR family transcriptional regulator [Rhizobium sp. SSA_523]MCO5734167.1 LysR family transcriptional regulator [Rhizobium sp. SSA_523]WKC21552.1 LysR family transcriptional regulator [Rhizobium sp. SSA_523]